MGEGEEGRGHQGELAYWACPAAVRKGMNLLIQACGTHVCAAWGTAPRCVFCLQVPAVLLRHGLRSHDWITQLFDRSRPSPSHL